MAKNIATPEENGKTNFEVEFEQVRIMIAHAMRAGASEKETRKVCEQALNAGRKPLQQQVAEARRGGRG